MNEIILRTILDKEIIIYFFSTKMRGDLNVNITIAVMIYNVGRFLSECIESIIKQKGDDIEILLIDDGSNDGSELICDKYALIDGRIRVIHQKNAGVAAARNVALDNAKGQWLIQIDGDDILLDGAIARMREYLDDDSDIIQFDSIPFLDSHNLPEHKAKGNKMIIGGDLMKEYHYQLIDKSQAKVFFPTYNLNPAWSKMWNMDFIRNNNLHYFPEVVKGEGTLFTFTASYVTKKVTIDPRPIYGYRLNPYSIMRRFSPDILENQDVQYRTYERVISSHGESNNTLIKEALYKRGMYLIENAIVLGICHPDCRWDKIEREQWINRLFSYYWVTTVSEYALSLNNVNKIYTYIGERDKGRLGRYLWLYRQNLKIRKILKRIGIR